MKIIPYLILIFCAPGLLWAQTTVSGKITEAATGSPIPFATVVFVGTTEGTISDFEGNFTASTYSNVDSIAVSYVGFESKVKPLQAGQSQTIHFQLLENVQRLDEIIITPGENPAFEVLRNVLAQKKKNDKRQLSAYEYESYTRTEFDINQISDKLRKEKRLNKIMNVMDSIERLVGEDGQSMLPLFISEAISRFYFTKNPFAKHEQIIKTKVNGVGVTDGTLVSQLIGSSYQEYNFYQNWLNIVGKEFASPISNSWKLIYDYELTDSLFIDSTFCYQIDFSPKQKLDLAFTGTMWVTKGEYAIKRIDAKIPRNSNLNYVNSIKIQQELTQTAQGPWLPEKTRVVMDIKPLSAKSAGLLSKFYVSNKDFVIEQPKDRHFYMNALSMLPTARDHDEAYWQEARHDSLSSTEINVFAMIDTLNQIPIIKNTTTAIKFAATGYISSGIFDIGPYTTFFGKNNIEGIRLGMGIRTNAKFSKRWTFGGYLGYGLDDESLKYNVYTTYIANRNQWTEWKYEQQREIEQIWLLHENIDAASLFYTFSRFGDLTQPFLKTKYRLSYQKQLGQGLNTTLALKNENVSPFFDFQFFTDGDRTSTQSSYTINELSASIRYGKDERFVINDNTRVSLGPSRYPIYTFSYAYGSKALSSDFEYHKIEASLEKKQKLGVLGVSSFNLAGGYILGDVPYSLLFNTIGNETPVAASFAYNQMNFFEFSSSRFIELKYNHSFEGFLFNRLPLLKHLKWRALLSANILYGAIDRDNINVSNFVSDEDGNEVLPFRLWGEQPYVELGYGIENILKVVTIQAFHRLTYLDDHAEPFGIKFSFDLNL